MSISLLLCCLVNIVLGCIHVKWDTEGLLSVGATNATCLHGKSFEWPPHLGWSVLFPHTGTNVGLILHAAPFRQTTSHSEPDEESLWHTKTDHEGKMGIYNHQLSSWELASSSSRACHLQPLGLGGQHHMQSCQRDNKVQWEDLVWPNGVIYLCVWKKKSNVFPISLTDCRFIPLNYLLLNK